MKQTYTVTVDVMCQGKGGFIETSVHMVQATTLGRAATQAKRTALAGRKAPYYAYTRNTREW